MLAVPTGAMAEDAQLPEIIVTAQKRAEDLKDIPVSVAVLDAPQIAAAHIEDYDDITRAVPGISFQAGAAPGLSTLNIRGVSSSAGSATVGLYIDDVPVSIGNEFDFAVLPRLFDVERVEVLRGPQGTLYGAGSMGGAIRFLSQQPDHESVQASAGTQLSETHHGGFNNDEHAILNAPLAGGAMAIRLAVEASEASGYVDHYIPTQLGAGPDGSVLSLGVNDSTAVLGRAGVNEVRGRAVHVSVDYLPCDGWRLTPALFWQDIDAADSGLQYPSMGLYAQDKRVPEPVRDQLELPSFTLEKRFPAAEFTSVTGYFRRDLEQIQDGTYYNSNVFANDYVASPRDTPQQAYADATVLGFLPSPVYTRSLSEQVSQEIRLSSLASADTTSSTVSWTVGVFFSHQHTTHLDSQYIPGLRSQFRQVYGYPIDSAASPVGPGSYPGVSYADDLIYRGDYYPAQRQLAPFAEVAVPLTRALVFEGGLRYVSAASAETVYSSGFYAYGLPASYQVRQGFSAMTPKLSLSYEVGDDSTAYVSATKGARLGGPTGPTPANAPGGVCDSDYDALGIVHPPTQYGSDSLWSYEVGSKGDYFGRRLSVNAAAYAIRWENIPQSIGLPTCGFGFTTNVGDARIYGGEVELRALATRSLELTLNASTTHAYIDSVARLAAAAVAPGESLLNVPRYTLTPGADYEIGLSSGRHLHFHTDFPSVGRSRAYFASSAVAHQFSPGYGILNLSAALSSGRFELGVYGKNVLGWKNLIQYPDVLSVTEGYTVRPATFGIGASVQL